MFGGSLGGTSAPALASNSAFAQYWRHVAWIYCRVRLSTNQAVRDEGSPVGKVPVLKSHKPKHGATFIKTFENDVWV